MMVSDEEKRWLVVGIAINKVAAPVLRDYIKQGMDTHYTHNTYCHGLTTPCTLRTLTYHHVNADPNLRRLKFQNINNNLHNYGNHKHLYNYNINSSVDLAKLFLPDYLANFSAFDESVDMSAILRLLGFNNPAPIFPSPNPALISIQMSADDVRENVRNKWGHCNVTDWSEVLFNDCFSKLETLVRSLGLTGGMEKTTLDRLSDWKTKGCQLCMGHAVDQNLLSLVQQDIQELIKEIKKTEVEQSVIQDAVAQQRTEQTEMQNSVALLQDQQSLTKLQLEQFDEELKAVLEWKEQLVKEKEIILEKLVSLEKALSEELVTRIQGVEDDLSEVKTHISQTDERVKQLKENVRDDVSQVKAQISQTDERVKELEENVRDQKMKYGRPANSGLESFDVKTCRSKLAEHYKRTATVPTSVWSKTSPVDIHQIYTRLSWVKEEQTLGGSSRSELKHYTDVFTAHKDGVVPKRILVDGQTGIGKSMFVKKLSVDWAELDDEKKVVKQKDALKGVGDDGDVNNSVQETLQDYKDTQLKEDGKDRSSIECEDTTSDDNYEDMSDVQKNALKNFEVVLVINLKEVSKCPSLKEVLCGCSLLPEEEATMAEGLLSYITKNQEKVLLVFDGYDEYRCGSNSEIYEIFRGKKLRDCCVLVTSRISKADELREFEDVHAEITGFSEKDGKAFMNRILGGEAEANGLSRHLLKKRLTDLSRVPLLLLFFCTLWRKGKSWSFPETKTKLYLAIVQYILDYSEGKSATPCFGKVQDFEEILSEIGKVALECLLKDDHVFEYDQLSNAVLSDKSRIIGLLQVAEYAENLRPAGMVSFIHKSIQEFLAAWYITYRCVPKGNLGGIEEHARKLENCDALNASIALENVFQFICGLSDDGAVKVFQHLASVRISDPTLDLSKTIPNVEKETDTPLCDVTWRHERFSDMVYDSCREVSSKAVLLRHYLECTGGIVLVSKDRPLSGLMLNVNVLTKLARNCVFLFRCSSICDKEGSVMYKSLELLDCLQMPLTIPGNSKLLTVRDLLVRDDRNDDRGSLFSCILCFSNGQFQFYITKLFLEFGYRATLFTESTADSVLSVTTRLPSEQSCLKFLGSLYCRSLRGQTAEALGAVIRNCKHLHRIEVELSNDSICDLLKQVPIPSKCSLKIGPSKSLDGGGLYLTSAGAVQLASLLPLFDNIITLDLLLIVCCSLAVDTLITSITHKTLKRLALTQIRLTPEAAAALGGALSEMSSLEELELTGAIGSILQAEEMKALFSGFNKTLPLNKLTFSNFNLRGCLSPLTKSFCFFPSLKELKLEELNMNEHDQSGLLESLRFFRKATTLIIGGKQNGPTHCYARNLNLPRVEESLNLNGINLTPAAAMCDINLTPESPKRLEVYGITMTTAVAMALGRSLPEMSSLLQLTITAEFAESILQTKELKALFGKLDKTLPLHTLTISGFSVRGYLNPLIKSLCFFPNLRELKIAQFNMDEHDQRLLLDEHDQCLLLESLRYISNIKALNIGSKPQGRIACFTAGSTLTSFLHLTSRSLKLVSISLTPATLAALGRSLPEMSSLNSLTLTVAHNGSILEAFDLNALFDRLDKRLPLVNLTFRGFSIRGSIAPLTNSLGFFPNLRELCLGGFVVDEHNLCCLLDSLRFVPNLTELTVLDKPLGYPHCHAENVNTVREFTHKALKVLVLRGMSLNSAAAMALGRLLSKMSSLNTLELTVVSGSILQTKEMEALFGGFNNTLPLSKLTFGGFSVTCCLAPLTKILRFFPDLRELNLEGLIIDDSNLCGLLESLRFIPNLKTLSLKGKLLCQAHSCTAEVKTIASIAHKNLTKLAVNVITLTPTAAALFAQLLPELPSLQELELTGVRGEILQAEQMEVLFGRFNKTLPLTKLTFSGFNVRGCLAPLTKSFRLFSNLRELCLELLNMDENDVCCLLQSFKFMPDLRALSVQVKDLGGVSCYTTELGQLVFSSFVSPKRLNLILTSLTPAVASALGLSLLEMSSLEEFELYGVDDSILKSEEMELLFGGLKKTLLLSKLFFIGFSVTGCLYPLTKSFRFFPNLRELGLAKLNMDEHDVCSLLESFRFMPNLRALNIRSEHRGNPCCMLQADKLNLDGIALSPAVITALGRVVPDMSSLQDLELVGGHEIVFQAEEIKTLFAGFNKTLPLYRLSFSGFSVPGCLAPVTEVFRFFPNLTELNLGGSDEEFNINEHNLCGLLDSLRFMPTLKTLIVKGKPMSQEHCCTAEVNTVSSITHTNLEQLNLDGIALTPALTTALGRLLPEMPSLQELKLIGVDGSIVQQEGMEALFGRFKRALPLHTLTFTGFSARGCLAPLTKSFCFFPKLTELFLKQLDMDEHDVCSLLENLAFGPNLGALSIQVDPLGQPCCTSKLHRNGSSDQVELSLDRITLTPAAAAALGRSLPEMSSLHELKLSGGHESILQAKEMEVLFGGFHRTMPLTKLTFSNFSITGCLAPLTKSLRFFSNMGELSLLKLNLNEQDQCGMLENFGCFSTLTSLYVWGRDQDSFSFWLTHSTTLMLSEISLTPAVVEVFGRSLPEMSSLRELELTGGYRSTLQADKIEVLFGGFNKTLPLSELTFRGFNVRGCLAPLTQSLQFFPNLINMDLQWLNITDHDLCGLLENFRFVPNLQKLDLSHNPLGHAVRSIVPHVINLQQLQYLSIFETCHSEEDLNYVRDTIHQARPELEIRGSTIDYVV